MTSTFVSFSSWIRAVVDHPAPLAEIRVGSDLPHAAADLGASSTRWTLRMPRLPSTIAHSIPAGPAPTTSTSRSGVARPARSCSGCQPRRYSSPRVAFWVQMIGADCGTGRRRRCSRCTPGSRRSGPPRSCSAGTGRRSTGRAAAMMSITPERIASAIVSGLVNRPTARPASWSPSGGGDVLAMGELAPEPRGDDVVARPLRRHPAAGLQIPEVEKQNGTWAQTDDLLGPSERARRA